MITIYLSSITDKNDEEKFAEIYRYYKDKMFRIAKNILKDDFLSEDAVHNTFIKVINNMKMIEDVKSIKTKSLIVTMTKNSSIDLYRSRNSERNDLYDEDLEIADNENIEESIISNIEYEAIVNEILLLPEKQRQLLFLKFVNELDIKSVAEVMNMSYSATQKGLQRARAKLIHNLSENSKSRKHTQSDRFQSRWALSVSF